MGRDLSKEGMGRVEGEAERETTGREVGRAAGSGNLRYNSESSSGSAETAVCIVDARGGGRVDREEVWDSAFGFDGREVFEAMGFYAGEATEEGPMSRIRREVKWYVEEEYPQTS